MPPVRVNSALGKRPLFLRAFLAGSQPTELAEDLFRFGLEVFFARAAALDVFGFFGGTGAQENSFVWVVFVFDLAYVKLPTCVHQLVKLFCSILVVEV